MPTTNNRDYWTRQRANSLGFLDREPVPPEARPGTCHLVFIGDSFVEATRRSGSGDIGEIERVFAEARDVIIGKAAIGAINVNGAVLSTLKGIKFDHQHGTVEIGNSVVSSDVLVTGGGPGAKKCFCVSNP